MATATPRGGVTLNRTLEYAHTAATAPGDVLVVNGNVVVAVNSADADEDNVYIFRGPVEFPKEAGLAIAPGETCYWVAANGNMNKTASGNTRAGIAKEAAAASDATVLIELQENGG